MPTMITNEDGEPIGIDYPELSLDWSDSYEDDYPDYEEDYEPDTVQDGFPYESDLYDEWI